MIDTIDVKIALPRELLVALDISRTEAAQRAQEWVILELFREGSISSGKAAEILRMSKLEFIELLNAREIPYLDLDVSSLEQDILTASAAITRH
ncbi:MAG: UPF0175 family protein [Chloroflexi bacterium]|nr:UPF0175 family protein [Chloroflexota bacterium]